MKSPRFNRADLERARRLLCSLQDHVRDHLLAATRGGRPGDLAAIAGVTASDTIYPVERIGEDAILAWFEKHWPKIWPVEIVMEGIEPGETATFPRGLAAAKTVFRCILDPIDGTRELMYDKRPAWTLAALAPQRGSRTSLADIAVAAMTELPISKQWRSDQVSAVRGCGPAGVVAAAVDVRTGARRRIRLHPSESSDCRQGFASFVLFFPEGKAFTAQIEEDLWTELYGSDLGARSPIFGDQYLTTGGQIYELLSGRDRMVADIRPLVAAKLGLKSLLPCHPYDICTALVLTESGGVVRTPDGRPLNYPLDTTTPVAWVGYANPALARAVGPALRRVLRRRFRHK